jgi:hypothetical protein
MKDTETASKIMSQQQEPKHSDTNELSSDELLLRAQGHEGELPRQFSSFAALSLAFVITNSWLGYCAVFVTPLVAGGGPSVFWGVIIAAIACLIISELHPETHNDIYSILWIDRPTNLFCSRRSRRIGIGISLQWWPISFRIHGVFNRNPSIRCIHNRLAEHASMVFDHYICGYLLRYAAISPNLS